MANAKFSTPTVVPSPNSPLEQEISSLRQDIRRLEGMLAQVLTPHPLVATGPAKGSITNNVRASLERSIGARKPYLLTLDGIITAQVRLSPMRAALLLTALLDFEERQDGGKGLADLTTVAIEIAGALDPETPRDDIANAVRVGLYRLEVFLEELRLEGKEGNLFLHLEPAKFRLVLVDRQGRHFQTPCTVEVQSSDRVVAGIIERRLSSSPLARARKRGISFVAGGPYGFDRLFLDLFDHPCRVVEHSLYYKPSIITYPLALLDFLGVSEEDKRRKKLMLEGMASERIEFVEILNRKTLWHLIQREQGKFKFYPENVTPQQIEDHMLSLMSMVKTLPGYHLCLTDSPLPFLLSTFEISQESSRETFTVFFKQEILGHDPDISCFVASDPTVYDSIAENVFNWVLNHPTTTRNRPAVIAEIDSILSYLREKGPLVST